MPDNFSPTAAPRQGLSQERGPVARELLLELFRHMGLGAEVTLRPGGDEIVLQARMGEGAEGAGLGGGRPTMQEPISYLLSKMVNRGVPEGGPRAVVRIGFGEAVAPESPVQTEETDPDLIALGRLLVERANKLGKTLTVGPMTARERRSLHVAVKDVGGATTRSEGDSLLRRVLIIPDPAGSTAESSSPSAHG